MLSFKETEDIDARLTEVDAAVTRWREMVAMVSRELRTEFLRRLRISLIFHDAALEGEVLTYSEIKAAVDPAIISDVSLIPSYEAIKHFDAAVTHAELLASKSKAIKLDTVKELYAVLAPAEKPKGSPYRKENPLHRLYYQEIAAPEKITYRMRKFGDWLDGAAQKQLHPIERVAETHHRLMGIFPYLTESGRLARVLSILQLRHDDYPTPIIHSIDRQRYFEALKGEPRDLVSLYLEAVETSAVSELQVYEEAAAALPRKRRA